MSEDSGWTPAMVIAAESGNLGNFLAAATPGGIEVQEAAGQRAWCASTDMPKDMQPSAQFYERLGFTFGEPVDDIFLSATLPPGWSRKATDHSMWSKIVDEKGRERVSVFYKAALYDRRAFCRLVCRFSVRTIYGRAGSPEGVGENEIAPGLYDGEKLIAKSKAVSRDDYAGEEVEHEALVQQLLSRYPNADDPTAHWDDP